MGLRKYFNHAFIITRKKKNNQISILILLIADWVEVVRLFGHILLNFNPNHDVDLCLVVWPHFGHLEIYLLLVWHG